MGRWDPYTPHRRRPMSSESRPTWCESAHSWRLHGIVVKLVDRGQSVLSRESYDPIASGCEPVPNHEQKAVEHFLV